MIAIFFAKPDRQNFFFFLWNYLEKKPFLFSHREFLIVDLQDFSKPQYDLFEILKWYRIFKIRVFYSRHLQSSKCCTRICSVPMRRICTSRRATFSPPSLLTPSATVSEFLWFQKYVSGVFLFINYFENIYNNEQQGLKLGASFKMKRRESTFH